MKTNKRKALIIKNITIEAINEIIYSIASGDKFNLTPEDLQIFRIWQEHDFMSGMYSMILTSDLFPIVKEGEIPREGVIGFIRKNEKELFINIRTK